MDNIKEQWPRAWEIIKEHVLRELNTQGANAEVMAQFPIDVLIQGVLKGASRPLYDILDEHGVELSVYKAPNKPGSKLSWLWNVVQEEMLHMGTAHTTRKEAEYEGFKKALEILDKK